MMKDCFSIGLYCCLVRVFDEKVGSLTGELEVRVCLYLLQVLP